MLLRALGLGRTQTTVQYVMRHDDLVLVALLRSRIVPA